MTVSPSIAPARLLHEQLERASPDLLRQLLTTFVSTLMPAEAVAVCGAAYGTSSPERVNQRNGYRPREFGVHRDHSRVAYAEVHADETAVAAGARSGPASAVPRRIDQPHRFTVGHEHWNRAATSAIGTP